MKGSNSARRTVFRALAQGLALAAVLGCSPASTTSTQTDAAEQPAAGRGPHDLAVLLDEGLVVLEDLRGKGASSGNAVEGAIRNLSGRDLRIDIAMAKPVFFRNSGRGQNMIAALILGADGGYVSDGQTSFIDVSGNQRTPISLVAFCADFEKDNPTAAESFTVDTAPPELAGVAARIAQHLRANPDADITVPGQVAVWLARGVSEEEIQEKFPFTRQDVALARAFLQ